MNKRVNFYSVIIGTELLNGRRKDAHFEFLNQELVKRGWEHKASFVIEDDKELMLKIFNLIKSDENSVMFCFGGIGATPDDFTRQIAADAFTNSQMEFHEEAKKKIENRFKEEAYPHRVNMAYLPIGAKLLKNVINDVSGFYLQDRFFFTPGFPSMSQSMVLEALDKLYSNSNLKKYRKTLTINTSENDLIEVMKKIPTHLEFSSLPKIIGEQRKVVISIAGYNQDEVDFSFQLFLDFCFENKKVYVLDDINDI
ncbi:molybdopterin-binding protein [Aliarcobacter cryaerophilus ATCC 43158]|uniref:Molybdopterin-binding protein, CinA family n=1 Tax=Aliarcobacter cryaerophilus ATCC 43158 TaxID=1032070 RepID=A0AAD0TWB7_9BACT|nr:molybdopterin-binding protein [Aliarcobacter cryaerophilus]AYJ80385.1 molybdopterin-binding protein, CinA family [Aliarcobacter cryaerophilus ATCC 43158]PRM98796.1 molybdopterin-binding protein [Aliarcobacter cryaerophilus]QCZ24597.1 molybdopterin-binding protein [Aliarcobacter cryaerophilus ATCC 43158]